jgi:Fur family ferric uptake transcriptional regulator
MGHTVSSASLLKQHSIRQTDSRMEILDAFISRSEALSQPDLEKGLAHGQDRVTIYRTLTLFVEKGILHKVLDDQGAMKYALCPEACSEHAHRHEHVHFKCTACGLTQCIEELEVPHFKLPKGFTVQESNILLQGVCSLCNQA